MAPSCSSQADSSSGSAGSRDKSPVQGCGDTVLRVKITEFPEGRKSLCEYRILLSSAVRINLLTSSSYF